MLDSVEEFRQVHVHAVAIAGPNVGCIWWTACLGRAFWPETETPIREFRIEDRREDL